MYRLGLDVGIKSVGWCVLECDENGEPIQINALNSRIFDAAEQPKTGASLAEPRRNARGCAVASDENLSGSKESENFSPKTELNYLKRRMI